jgi:hypothetical protein
MINLHPYKLTLFLLNWLNITIKFLLSRLIFLPIFEIQLLFDEKYDFPSLSSLFIMIFILLIAFWASKVVLMKSLPFSIPCMVEIPGNTLETRDPEGIRTWKALSN